MAKNHLTDLQRVILSNASMQLDHRILPVPKSLTTAGERLSISLRSLLSRGLIKEIVAQRGDALWREDARDGQITLAITAAGLSALGVSIDDDVEAKPVGGELQPVAATASLSAGRKSAAKLPRDGSKLAVVVEALCREAGATISDIMEVTGWQAHSVRGAMSGALKKTLGMTITSEVVEGRGRVYRATVGLGGVAETSAAATEADLALTDLPPQDTDVTKEAA
jgi:hypothetical protein